MIVNRKRLCGTNVYILNETEPCGKVTGICFSKKRGNVEALTVETLSLIPIQKKVLISDVYKITESKIVLKRYIDDKLTDDIISEKSISEVKKENRDIKKIKDINFYFETGEISDIVIKRSLFGKKEIIPVHNLKIKNNTMTIE